MKSPRRGKGFTLFEIILALGLFTVLGVVIWQLLAFGIRAHRKGENTRLAQHTARSVVDTLAGEIRSAVPLPLPVPPIFSSVLWPDPWGVATGITFGGSSDGHFDRVESTTDEGVRVDLVRNRLIISRAGRPVGDEAFNPNLVSEHVLVEYVVPANARNTLQRNVYRLDAIAGIQTQLVTDAQGNSASHWVVEPGFYVPDPTIESTQTVVELADPDDLIYFEVSHREFSNPSDPGGTQHVEIFDPRVYQINVVIGVDPQEQLDEQEMIAEARLWSGYARQQSQVRVQSAETLR